MRGVARQQSGDFGGDSRQRIDEFMQGRKIKFEPGAVLMAEQGQINEELQSKTDISLLQFPRKSDIVVKPLKFPIGHRELIIGRRDFAVVIVVYFSKTAINLDVAVLFQQIRQAGCDPHGLFRHGGANKRIDADAETLAGHNRLRQFRAAAKQTR